MYKFRTMKKDSHELRDELSELNKHSGPLFKIENDPRIIKGTEFLRSYSLDELPQLFNVLKGDMSFIGPRPLLVSYLALYNDEQKKRHHVKPGITGWAQVNGRNAITWEQKFIFDVFYVNNISFTLDLKIFLLTIKKVLKSEGINTIGVATTESFKGNDNE